MTLIARINPSDNGTKMELRIIGRRWIPSASKMELWIPKSKMDFISSKVDIWRASRRWALQMLRVLGSLVVTELLSKQREENED